jgi:asparagine N-glycosylation enzyme membrane subunit Stt3
MEKGRKATLIALSLILALALLVRAYPLMLGSAGGPDPFYHARMAGLFIDGQSVPEYDALSMQGRPYTYSPLFHISLALFSLLSGLPLSLMLGLYPLLYGVLAVLLLFVLSRRTTPALMPLP